MLFPVFRCRFLRTNHSVRSMCDHLTLLTNNNIWDKMVIYCALDVSEMSVISEIAIQKYSEI